MKNQSLPLQEIISRIVVPDLYPSEAFPGNEAGGLPSLFSGLGTMQSLNRRLVNQPSLDFINYNLRGIGQVIFVNNPLSGFLILLALFIQSPGIGFMSLIGVLSSTVTAQVLKLDSNAIRNGIFGYNGILVGAALATFAISGKVTGNFPGSFWYGLAIAIIIFSALTTVMMKYFGVWWAKTFKSPPLTLTFNISTLLFLSLVMLIPQPFFQLGETTASANIVSSFDLTRLLASLPIGFGQVFLADKLVPASLILFAVAICTPLGAIVGLVGGILGVIASWLLGITPENFYSGLCSYNSILAAMAICGVFYAPNMRSFLMGSGCAFLSALAVLMLQSIMNPLFLPVLTLPFCITTIGFFLVLQRSLPSLVPVALHTVTTPEEHRQRYLIAKNTISQFRNQLRSSIIGQNRNFLFEKTSAATKGDIRYLFNIIDTDSSGEISTEELANYLLKPNRIPREDEFTYLFNCIDKDGNGMIDFEEFGELLLRQQRLMAQYEQFKTYFLPIDADEDNLISIKEMNVAMTSIGESPLTREEVNFLQNRTGSQSFSWNQFIELLLLT